MSSTKDIRRRIKSIKSTRQITGAMELVAAAKMRKAQQQALATRTYAKLAWELIQNLSEQTDPRIHKLLRQSPRAKKAVIVLITSNRGLIGGFNNAIIATALALTKEFPELEFICLGKKGREAVRKRGLTVVAEFEKLDAVADVLEIRPLASLASQDFVSGKYDVVSMVYMDFVSTLKQVPHVARLLPLVGEPDQTLDADGTEYLFEPSPDEVLETLLPRLVQMQIYQALLETNAAEHSARMVAMKNASDAATDLIDDLTLEYNQIRQAGITKEISEIAAGRLALNR